MATIGSVKASTRQIAVPDSRVSADSFGAGVARGLAGLAQSKKNQLFSEIDVKRAEQQLANAYQTRQEQSQRAEADVELVRLRGNLTREVADRHADMPRYGANFTNDINQLANENITQFLESLPEGIREEYGARAETLLQGFTTEAFGAELTAQSESYVTDWGDFAQAQSDLFLMGGAGYEAVMEDANSFLRNSPLTEEQTLSLRNDFVGVLELYRNRKELEIFAENPLSDEGSVPGQATGEDVMATGMPGYARGFLNSAVDITVTPGQNPLLHTDGGESHMTQEYADERMQYILNGPYRQLQAALGFDVPINDAIAKAGTSRETETPGSDHFHGEALDIDISGMSEAQRLELFYTAVEQGFTSFGFGTNIMHMGTTEPRTWNYNGITEFAGESISNLRNYLLENANPVDFQIGVPEGSPYRTNVNDLAEHPGTPAGRYNLSQEAWDEAAEVLNLSDFGPASQDRAAWWLAQQHYEEETGRSLEAALNSGDTALIEEARTILVTSEDADFSYLAETSPEDFFDSVTGTQATYPSTVYNGGAGQTSFTERVNLYNEVMTNSQAQQNQIAERAQAQREAFLQDLKAQIELGSAGMSDIQEAEERYSLTAQELVDLNTVMEEKNTRLRDINEFTRRAASGGFVFNADRDKQGVEALAADNWAAPVAEGDEEFFYGTVLPNVQNWQYVPEAVQGQLTNMVRSSDTTQAGFALRAMRNLYGVADVAFADTFGEEMTKEVILARNLQGAVPEEQILERMRASQDPSFVNTRQNNSALVEQNREDYPARFRADDIVQGFLENWKEHPELLATPSARFAIESEFNSLYRWFIYRGANHTAAVDSAHEQLSRVYGESQTNGGTVMRHPPERMYSALTPEDFQRQAREAAIEAGYELTDDQEVFVFSDNQTEAGVATRGESPSYHVWIKDENGNMTPLYREQTGLNGNTRTAPLHVQFEGDAEANEAQLQLTLRRNRYETLTQRFRATNNSLIDFEAVKDGVRNSIPLAGPALAEMLPTLKEYEEVTTSEYTAIAEELTGLAETAVNNTERAEYIAGALFGPAQYSGINISNIEVMMQNPPAAGEELQWLQRNWPRVNFAPVETQLTLLQHFGIEETPAVKNFLENR